MESPELLDDVLAGAEVQVVGVAEDDLRPDRPHLVRVECLDRRLGSNGHEGRSGDRPVSRRQNSGARRTVGRMYAEAHRDE